MSVNSASSARAAEVASSRVPAPRTARGRGRRIALAIAIAAGWLGLGVVGVVSLGGLAVRAVVWALTIVPRAIVWLFLAAESGADWWSIAGRAGGAIMTALGSSQVIWWLIGLELLGVAALAGLHRMLRAEARGRDVEEVKE